LGKIKDRKVNNFLGRVRSKFNIEKIILFGSRARNDYLKGFDYDFILVSKDFEKYNFLDRISEVMREGNINFSADILCYTPKEFNKKKKEIGIIGNAMKEGIEIA